MCLLIPKKEKGLAVIVNPVVKSSPLAAQTFQLKQKAIELAIEYHVNADHMIGTIECESQWLNVKSKVDSNSWGIVQININNDAHPEITKEQALNPEFSLEFMASQFSKGKASEWTCWRHKYAQ